MFGCMTLHRTSIDDEPNDPNVPNADANLDTSGARFVPIVDLSDDTHPLQRPGSAHLALSKSRSHQQGRPVRNVHSLRPIPNQTGLHPWQSQNFQCVLAALGSQKADQLCTPREASHHQRETARRAPRPQQGEFLAATHQYEAAARHNLVNTLARVHEVHNYKVQMQVRQLEQEADARLSQRGRVSRFSQEANQAVGNQPENLVTEVTSEVWRRDEQVYDLHTELSLQAPHQEDVTQHQSQEYAEPHQPLTVLVQEREQYREMFEESRAAHSPTGP